MADFFILQNFGVDNLLPTPDTIKVKDPYSLSTKKSTNMVTKQL